MYVLLTVAIAFAVTEIAVVATSIYLHRGLAHRSLKIHSATDVMFRTILWITTGKSRQQWVAIHRRHHAFTDAEGDLHSPRLLGYWRVQLFNAYYYIVAGRDQSLHNNHHAHLRAPRFSVRSSEFDPLWPIIQMLAALRFIVIAGTPVRLGRTPAVLN